MNGVFQFLAIIVPVYLISFVYGLMMGDLSDAWYMCRLVTVIILLYLATWGWISLMHWFCN